MNLWFNTFKKIPVKNTLRGNMKEVFHAYDIRGIANEEITDEFAYRLGAAYAQLHKPTKVVVAHDARLSGPQLSQAVILGLTDMGVQVINIGLTTTPAAYFAINHLDADGGIIVTASHNPKEYNGFKIRSKNSKFIYKENGC